MRVRASSFMALFAGAWALSCNTAGSTGSYGVAGAVLAGTIAEAGVQRAVTGDCWAQCTAGYACARARGTCVRAECVPACAPGEHCVIEQDDRFRCIDTLGTARLGSPVSSVSGAAPAPPSNTAPGPATAPR